MDDTVDFGVDVKTSAKWLATIARDRPAAFVALARRDVVRGIGLLVDNRGHLDREDRRQLARLRVLYEVARLVEHMRMIAGPDRVTSESVLTTLMCPILTQHELGRNRPLGEHLADGWMHINSLRAIQHHAGPALDPRYPLTTSSKGSIPMGVDVAAALFDPATFAFHSATLSAEPIVAGMHRTLLGIGGEQPVGTIYGIEQLRLPALALRSIARKCGHAGALSQINRSLSGRLALYLLKAVDPSAFAAYADRWGTERTVKRAGLTRADLCDRLTDPEATGDIGAALVFKSEQVRKPVVVAPVSPFNPWLWNRVPATISWSGYAHAARREVPPRPDDGARARALLAGMVERGTASPRFYRGSEEAAGRRSPSARKSGDRLRRWVVIQACSLPLCASPERRRPGIKRVS